LNIDGGRFPVNQVEKLPDRRRIPVNFIIDDFSQ